ncbi:MAG TPA: globin [Candidatus Polarisedimenticolia bacterium]|nr:globin [Candidatus Polarisedimenticolia bacterium]
MVEQAKLKVFDDSLRRCNAREDFLDLFYDSFLASSPKVREKFAKTDFVHQKRALRASLHMMLLAAEHEGSGPERYLKDLARQHSRNALDIGAELYDLWLDSLIRTVKECDPQFSPEIEAAWEDVMMIGIRYMLAHYHDHPQGNG